MVNGYLTSTTRSRAIGSAASRAVASPAASRAVAAAMAAASRVGPIAGGAAIAGAVALGWNAYQRHKIRNAPFPPLPGTPSTMVTPAGGNWVLVRDCGDQLPEKWVAKSEQPSCKVSGEHDYWILGRMGQIPANRWDSGVYFYASQWDPVPYRISASGWRWNYSTFWRKWRNYGAKAVPPPNTIAADGTPAVRRPTFAPPMPGTHTKPGLFNPPYNPTTTVDPGTYTPPYVRPGLRPPLVRPGLRNPGNTRPETEGMEDRDLVDDTYTHVMPPVLVWQSRGPDVVISQARALAHARRAPAKGEKERKVKAGSGAYRALSWALEMTEFKDAVDSIYEAIPGAPRVSWITFRVGYIYEHWDEVDLNQAAYNLVYNALEDRIVGGAQRRVADARKKLGQRPGDVWGL